MKKTSYVFVISTMLLCLGVMVVGVYSAMNASLNIAGTLGFNMHDCIVSVEGTIFNLAEVDASTNVVSKIDKTIATTIMGGESTTTANLSLGELYFYYGAYADPTTGQTTSKVYDIIFQLVFTNISDTSIKISSLNLPTVGSGVTLVHGNTNADYTNLSNYSTIIAEGKSATILFALNLIDSSAVLSAVNFSWSNVCFEETESLWEQIHFDATNNYYYIKMGVNPFNNNEPLRWISFAEKQDSGAFEFYDKTNAPASGKTYYFISELILRTEYSTSPYDGGLAYQNDFIYDEMFNEGNITNTSYAAKDYAMSNIRKYLNGNQVYNYAQAEGDDLSVTVTTSGKLVDISSFQITTSSIYCNHITARALSELYEISQGMNTTYDCGIEADKLWLLSCTVNTERGDSSSEADIVVDNYGALANSVDGGCNNARWWLRSSGTSPSGARFVDGETGGIEGYIVMYSYGVRPGFQITIP